MSDRPEDTQAAFCATLVDEWSRAGVRHAVVAPGSRSTPLALALLAHDGLAVHVHIDERSAGFLAIGLAAASGQPTVLLTTSGTAAVELHPAVVEAHHARLPLIVCTADRPPELIGVAAPQAIDQAELYGTAVRWFHAPGVADPAAAPRWRPLASRAYGEATGGQPGPVHLNLAFREPLTGDAVSVPAGRPDGRPWTVASPAVRVGDHEGVVLASLVGRRGLVVAGAGSGPGAAVRALAEHLGWPVLAAPQAPVWSETTVTIAGVDGLLRVPSLAEELTPEVVLHLGSPLASRVAGEWLAASGADHVVVSPGPAWVDPHGIAAVLLRAEPDQQVTAWLTQLGDGGPRPVTGWAERWRELSGSARRAIDEVLAEESGASEPATIQALLDNLPEGGNLVVSSSMPVRDLEWYVRPRSGVTVVANRGANGIDGVVSTAVGVAAGSGCPTGLAIGDLAFLHDTNGLLGAAARGVDLTVVVLDNDGGGIFSFLPQAGSLPVDDFERLFGTPHGLDLAAVAAAHGASAVVADDPAPAIGKAVAAGGLQVVVVRGDRDANRALHARLNEAVALAVSD